MASSQAKISNYNILLTPRDACRQYFIMTIISSLDATDGAGRPILNDILKSGGHFEAHVFIESYFANIKIIYNEK